MLKWILSGAFIIFGLRSLQLFFQGYGQKPSAFRPWLTMPGKATIYERYFLLLQGFSLIGFGVLGIIALE